MRLELARAVADAVLMEGYALYPYRASAPKNRFRWTFGVLAPRAWSEAGGCEPWWLQAQVLVAGTHPQVSGRARFFQIERRRVQDEAFREVSGLDVGGSLALAWDAGLSQTVDFRVYEDEDEVQFSFGGVRKIEAQPGGRVLWERHGITGRVLLRQEKVAADRPLVRLTIRVENTTPWREPGAPRDAAIVAAFASTHVMLGVEGGEILSAVDPPAWASEAAAACKNVRTFPVLVGPPGTCDVMLAAPFALYDHPQIAPESTGDLCDASEIDELLVLRTRTLGEDEKRQARATDPRAAEIIDRAEALTDEQLARMHGTSRDVCAGEMVPREHRLAAGSKVRLRPSSRRTDAQDLLYVGHVATVAEVRQDVDGTIFLAVTIDDDPAAELHDWYGRYHYYRTDEVEPL